MGRIMQIATILLNADGSVPAAAFEKGVANELQALADLMGFKMSKTHIEFVDPAYAVSLKNKKLTQQKAQLLFE